MKATTATFARDSDNDDRSKTQIYVVLYFETIKEIKAYIEL